MYRQVGRSKEGGKVEVQKLNLKKMTTAPPQRMTRHEKELVDLMAMNQSMDAPDIQLSDTGRSVRSSTRTSTNAGAKQSWLIPPELKSRKWELKTTELGRIRVKRWHPIGDPLLGASDEMGSLFDMNAGGGSTKQSSRRRSMNTNKPRPKRTRI